MQLPMMISNRAAEWVLNFKKKGGNYIHIHFTQASGIDIVLCVCFLHFCTQYQYSIIMSLCFIIHNSRKMRNYSKKYPTSALLFSLSVIYNVKASFDVGNENKKKVFRLFSCKIYLNWCVLIAFYFSWLYLFKLH